MTGVFMVALLEHRNRRVLQMGDDSLAVILFGCGLGLLSAIG